jgi:cytoskeletal protein RodZ
MAEEEKKDSKSKVIIIVLIIVIFLILAGVAVTMVILLNNNNSDKQAEQTTTAVTEESEKNKNPLILDYDSAAVALDEQSLSDQYNKLQEKASEGNVAIEMQNIAFSDDGINFTCYLANSSSNTEDMFLNIYKDSTLTEQIYLSGLLAPGTVIEKFSSEIKLDPGNYETILIFTTVADDHETMTSQTPIVLTLQVG